MKSDEEFNRMNGNLYDFIILDPWTWAGKGWIAKKCIQGFDNKIFMLDFFGFHKLPNQSLKIPDSRFLTAFGGSKDNTFLGYYLPNNKNDFNTTIYIKKKNQGIIWGKDIKHYSGDDRSKMLNAIADIVPLISTTRNKITNHDNIIWVGHQTKEQWNKLLYESKFMIGLGDPLLGPSAVDAISHGCVYINPQYDQPIRGGNFYSQHPYAEEKIGYPYVCAMKIKDINSVLKCVKNALAQELSPPILTDFTEEAYLNRVKNIFSIVNKFI